MPKTANLFIDWQAAFHTPPYQACDFLPLPPGATVEHLMNETGNCCNPSITYSSIGSGDSAYLTAIDGVESNQDGNGYYWVYYVNGIMPSIGFGAYQLSGGDSVAWDYIHYSSGLS
ncbi:MAG: DUF4430 domain-containing protein [Synechococcus sp.]